MIGARTRYSLVQFLGLQEPDVTRILLQKYNVPDVSLPPSQLLRALESVLLSLDEHTTMLVLSEVVASDGDLRARINPKYRFDERMADLTKCLLLDGYLVQSKKLVLTDPSIAGASPVEDDLIQALSNCGAPRKAEIIARINDSASTFRASPPDFNATLVHARVALETLAADIAASAATRQATQSPYDPTKWGEVIAFLRKCGEISLEEEKGLAGVYGFLSVGAHRSVGIPQDQMTRLGRSFALNMCWFLLKNHLERIK